MLEFQVSYAIIANEPKGLDIRESIECLPDRLVLKKTELYELEKKLLLEYTDKHRDIMDCKIIILGIVAYIDDVDVKNFAEEYAGKTSLTDTRKNRIKKE
jgi:hypothetical protein